MQSTSDWTCFAFVAWSDIIKLTNDKHVTFALYAGKWRSLERHFAFIKSCVTWEMNKREKKVLHKKLNFPTAEEKLTYRNFLAKRFAKRLCGYCFVCAAGGKMGEKSVCKKFSS